MAKLLIFDLDGTLVDSAEDIARSVNELLSTLGRDVLSHERIRSYIGDGVQKLLERALEGAPPGTAASAVAPYLEIYRRRLLDHTRPYPGVVAALDELRPGRSLAVLTNKPARESRAILEGLDLDRYFDAVYGGDSLARKKPDPIGIVHLMNQFGADRDETVFVGDSAVDVRTALAAGVRSCLVTYGLDRERAEPLAPDWQVSDLRELVPLVHP
jgi:phosphoglycolate phosphatase